jgi:Leucine-rich repeat (LRR) protein
MYMLGLTCITFCDLQLKGLKEKSLLQNFDESSTGIGVHDLWREFAAEEANTVGKLQGSSVWFYDNDEDGAQHRGEASLSGGGWENLHRASIWRRGKLKDKLNFSLCSNLTVLTLRNVPSANQQLNLTPLKCLKHLEVNGPVREVLGLGSLAHLVVLRWFRMPAISSCLQEIGLLKNLQVLQLQFLPWKRKDSSRVKFHQMDFSRLSLLRVFSLSAPGDEWWPFSSYSRDVRFLGREIQHEIYGRYAPRFDGGVHMTGRLGNFHNLQSLQELDISRCVCIRALPGLDELVGLLELKASGCGSLEELPSLEKLQRLQRLDVSYCFAIRALPGLDELVGLVALDACGCCNLEELPSLQKLQHLQRLDISVCSTIKAVPGLGDLVSLLALRAGGCRSLEELPSLQKLQKLQRLDISGCHLITALPGFGDLVALQELRAQDCFNLAELPDLRQLTSLRVLNLKKASYYQEYQMKRPEETYIEGEPAVITAVPGLDELLALSKLTVDFRVFEDSAPHDLRKLRILTRVTLSGWSSEAALGVASLPNLQVLRISYGGGVEPTGVSSLRSLTRLKLYRCDFEDASCLSSSPALQHLHVKSHRSNQKKLLVSLIDIPSLRFTVHVDHGEDRDWYPIRHEIEALRARSQHLSSSSNSSPCQN